MDDSDSVLEVLLVEQQSDLISAITTLLSDIKECRFQVLSSYQEALLHISTVVPDLLLFADGLPEMDGMQVLGEIRAKHPSVYCIVSLTAGKEEVISGYIEKGANGFIFKNKNYIHELISEVKKALIRVVQRKTFLHSSVSGSSLFADDDSSESLSLGTLHSGQTILHYRIIEELGKGGMGQVYKAEDLKLGRYVALKVLPPRVTKDQTAKLRLVREARSASGLNHPNIITIHAIEEVGDLSFIVMEYIEGESLWQRIQEGTLEFSKILDIGLQVAEALSVAHAAALIHRDIKPGNIMITARGQVKLLDFGLAKWVSGKPAEAALNELTAVGVAVGTIPYMSPEQTRGEQLDARSDIFSLGCVLYRSATGNMPFESSSVFTLLQEIASADVVPPSSINSDFPLEFDRIIARALAKDKADRYSSASELANDLRKLQTSRKFAHPVSIKEMETSFPAPARATQSPRPVSVSGKDQSRPENTAKIFLVEDNEDNRDMLSRRLQRKGFQVLIAVNGEEAVEMIPQEQPDLVLMDISLPVMDGFEAIRRLKSNEKTKQIPIIALTAHAMSGDRERTLAAGCDDYDTKPVDFQRLLTKIDTWLKNRPATS